MIYLKNAKLRNNKSVSKKIEALFLKLKNVHQKFLKGKKKMLLEVYISKAFSHYIY